ncbi:MAG: hypothetical protein HY754_12035 [Nitrospirae bacterium]|nr:hypothetical protein [Nitrospirota bacterium]
MMQDTRYTIHDARYTPLCPPLVRGELKGGVMHHASCIVHHEFSRSKQWR